MHTAHFTKVCDLPWRMIEFYPEGSFDICPGRTSSLGNVKNLSGVEEAWTCSAARELRSRMNGGDYHECRSCVHYCGNLNATRVPLAPPAYRTKYRYALRPLLDEELLSPPREVFCDLTFKCNLHCAMCPGTGAWTNRLVDAPSMPPALFEHIARVYFSQAETVFTNTLGELFVYEHLDEALRILRRYRPSDCGFLSNASHTVDDDQWRRLMETHDWVSFSLDAASEEIHQSIRAFPLSRFQRTLDQLQQLAQSEFPHFHWRSSMVVMRANVHEMMAFARRSVDEWGCREITFANVSSHWRDLSGESALTDLQYARVYNEQIEQLTQYAQLRPECIFNLPQRANLIAIQLRRAASLLNWRNVKI